MTVLTRSTAMTPPDWFRLRLGCVAASTAVFAAAVIVIGALTPGYNQWSDAVSRLASPGERWALAARAAFAVYGLLVIAGASTVRPYAGRHGRTLAACLILYGVAAIAAMALVAGYGPARAARRAAAALAVLTVLAAVVFRYAWGTELYGVSERVLLGLGMCWISVLAGSALYQGRSRAR